MADTKTELRNTAPVRLMQLDTANVLLPFDRPMSEYLTGKAGTDYPRRKGMWHAAAEFLYELRWKDLDACLYATGLDGEITADAKKQQSGEHLWQAITIQPPPPPAPVKKEPGPVTPPPAKPQPVVTAKAPQQPSKPVFEVPIVREMSKPVPAPAPKEPEKPAATVKEPAVKEAEKPAAAKPAPVPTPAKPIVAPPPPAPAPVPKPAPVAKPVIAPPAKPAPAPVPPGKPIVAPKPTPAVAAKAATGASATTTTAAVVEKQVVEARTAEPRSMEPKPSEPVVRIPEPSLAPAARTAQPLPKPAERERTVETPKPVELPKPAARETAKPAEVPKPSEPSKPVEQPKPAEVIKPVESTKPESLAIPSFGGATPSSSTSYADSVPEPGGGLPIAVKAGIPVVLVAAIGWYVFFGSNDVDNTKKAAPQSSAQTLTVGEQGWVTEWASDAGGSRRGRQLTLYRPSMSLSDYKLKFTGTIESGALGWVIRAADTKNYYAMKIVVTRPGPPASLAITRLAVVDGRESSFNEKPLAIRVPRDLSFNVEVQAKGPNFTVYVQGQPVDVWTDNRLKSGAVGLMNEREERARTTAVQFDFMKAGSK